jgi:TolA-binding protein
VDLGEVLIRIGAKAEARAHLEAAAAAEGSERPRALLLLAELEEELGNRERALAAYDRVLRDHPVAQWSARNLLSHARLLEGFGQRDRARPLLQQIVETSGEELASEAAYRLGRIQAADGEHAAAVEWHLTAAYLAESSRWARHALLEAGRSLTALHRTNEALIVYRKLMPAARARGASDDALRASSSVRIDQPEDREMIGEAAYRIAEILRGAGDEESALDMYLTAAHVTAGAPAARRALLGAMRSLLTMGDRASAEAIYRRLLESSDSDPALLAEARRTLRGRGGNPQDAGAALPRTVRD